MSDESEAVILFSREDLEAAKDQGRARLDPEQAEENERLGDRVRFNGMQKKLDIYGARDPGYVYRWFVNDGDRVLRAISGGWQPCVHGDDHALEPTHEMGEPGDWITQRTGSNGDGSPQSSVLMAIKKELHAQDQRAKAQIVDDKEQDIRRNQHARSDGSGLVYAGESNTVETNFSR